MVVSKLHSIPSKGVVLIMAAENPRKAQAVERKNISVKINVVVKEKRVLMLVQM